MAAPFPRLLLRPSGAPASPLLGTSLDAKEVHTINSSAAFGIVVYGYGRFTSYMYPGGLDLERISPPPVF